jgi:sugar phosphate isomerase/epimerase
MPRMNRRTFIGNSVAATVAASRLSWAAETVHKIDRIGMQLYTVRDAMKVDFDGTLAKVVAIGYREVEFAGYFGHAPKDVRAMLDKHKLVSPSEHVPYADVQDKWQQTLDAAHVVGQKHVVCPSIDEKQRNEPGGWKRAFELFNRAGEASQKAAIQFAYHNHTFEFEPSVELGGKLPYDVMLAETDPKLVKMEMDLCWITLGGQDPLTYFDKYPGRFPMVHVKDWTKGENGKMSEKEKQGHMADVGAGAIDWKRIFAQSNKAGIKHYFVEHDEPKSPFDSLRNSYKYLHDLRF